MLKLFKQIQLLQHAVDVPVISSVSIHSIGLLLGGDNNYERTQGTGIGIMVLWSQKFALVHLYRWACDML